MSQPLSITLAAHDQALVVRPSGALDLEGAPVLKRALQHVDAEAPVVVIDLSEVTFIDSTAISVLIGFQQHLGPSRVLRLRNLSEATERLLHWTGLEGTFQVDDELAPLGRPMVVWRSDPEPDVVAHGGGPGTLAEATGEAVELSEDAATVVGLVSTALPFASDSADQVERWLRALARNGNAGFLLEAAGVHDAPSGGSEDAPERAPGASPAPPGLANVDPVDAVTLQASRLARSHGERLTRSTDLLQAVRDLYGDVFTAVLRRHSTDPEGALERLNHLLVGQ